VRRRLTRASAPSNRDFASKSLARTWADAHYPRMFPQRTTKPTRLHWLAVLFCAATPVFCVSAVAADAAAETLIVRFDTSQASAAAPTRMIDLQGTAAGACAPTLRGMSLDGSDLNVELHSPDTGCDVAHTRAFHLRADLSKGVGTPLVSGQVYRVRVFSTKGSTRVLRGFQLLDTSTSDAAPRPENGFWWSQASAETGPASPGSGTSLEWQDGQLAVGLFGFSDTGTATWYFGSARPAGRIASVSLVQLSNGDSLFSGNGASPVAASGPRLDIELISPTRARAWLIGNVSGRDLQVRPLVLARSPFSSGSLGSNWSGQWILVPDDEGTPRIFDFGDPSSQEAETFHLADDRSNATLDCRLGTASRQPEMCTLSAGAAPIADFDQVGIDHLSGRGNGGGRMKLVRVPR